MGNNDDLIKIFSVCSNKTRLDILLLLSTSGPKCVKDIRVGISLSQAAVSQHLAILRNESLVKTIREKNFIYYYLTEKAIVLFREAEELFKKMVNHDDRQ